MTAADPATGSTRMTPAEFRVVREFLGLTGDWLARHLEVNPRTVRGWEQARYPVPATAAAEVRRIADITRRTVDAALSGQLTPLVTYRTDAEYREHDPYAVLPASWHRAMTARVLAMAPCVRVIYLPGTETLATPTPCTRF